MKRNYAFIQFETIEQATKAKDTTNGGKLDQSVLTVEYVANRRDRGGGGGRYHRGGGYRGGDRDRRYHHRDRFDDRDRYDDRRRHGGRGRDMDYRRGGGGRRGDSPPPYRRRDRSRSRSPPRRYRDRYVNLKSPYLMVGFHSYLL